MAKSYAVLTVGEIDHLVHQKLLEEGVASAIDVSTGRYEITDRAKAHSSRIMPMVLNPYGHKGWRLCAVNSMQCFIFEVDPGHPVEYLVSTPPDLDKLALSMLEEEGAAKVTRDKDGQEQYEITQAENARIQFVLPKLLAGFAETGWELVSVSGPQLYFFVRPHEPATT